jgi:hypothetical protein
VTEYRTEQDKFSRILGQGSDGGPDSFVVYRKDGCILEYSPVTPTKPVWLLVKERDRAGNEIRYDYDVTVEDGIEYHPSAIQYTYQRNTNSVGQRKVVFSYEERPDPTFAYVSGVSSRRPSA